MVIQDGVGLDWNANELDGGLGGNLLLLHMLPFIMFHEQHNDEIVTYRVIELSQHNTNENFGLMN